MIFFYYYYLLISCYIMYYFPFKLNTKYFIFHTFINCININILQTFCFSFYYFFVYAHIEVPILKGHVSNICMFSQYLVYNMQYFYNYLIFISIYILIIFNFNPQYFKSPLLLHYTFVYLLLYICNTI